METNPSPTNSFAQPAEGSFEKAESVTSETSSHKMRIDELNCEEDHSMEVDNNSVKHTASSSGSISKKIFYNKRF